jgi:hypothetical protein
MGRMASMQVINNAFNNLNGAFSTIMQHNRQNRAMDIEEQYQKDLLAYRQAIAAQDQANKDRDFKRLVDAQVQAQKNWDTTHQDKLNDQAYARELAAKQEAEKKAEAKRQKIQNDLKEMSEITEKYGAGMAVTYAHAQAGDPIARNLYMQGLDKYNQNQKTQQLYSRYLNDLNTIKKEREKQANAEKKANDSNKIKPSDIANLVSNGVITPKQGNDILNANYNLGLNSNSKTRPPLMTPEQKKKYIDKASKLF